MKLVIHDLNEAEWNRIAEDYGECEVISDDGTINPCVGCFGCWLKTPGVCVLNDKYNHMGELIHKAEEIVIISRFTYGGFSGLEEMAKAINESSAIGDIYADAHNFPRFLYLMAAGQGMKKAVKKNK